MKLSAFWDIVPCSLVGVNRRFIGTYSLHHQGDDGDSGLFVRVFRLKFSMQFSFLLMC
jgi:hypothetical protein